MSEPSRESKSASKNAPVWMNDIETYFTHTDIVHMAARGVHLDSYMWVSMNYPNIIGRIESKSMPPGGWSDQRIARFKEWAKAGWPRVKRHLSAKRRS
jgi:hypothetical protein